MIKVENKYNRFLPKSVGIEIESQRQMMEALRLKLRRFFPSGNSESSAIYECQTAPVYTNSIIDVALLGEVVRRCIPNYVVGGYDRASASAHCHVVGFRNNIEVEHIEALMIGLMPFLSLGWLRPTFKSYVFRASVTGTGECSRYARFTAKSIDTDVCARYSGRYTWVRDQTDRHQSNAIEIRSNENSPLWLYFINPILTNQEMMDKLRAMIVTDSFKKQAGVIKFNNGTLDIYNDFIEEVKLLIIPFLLEALPGILEVIEPTQREFASVILEAYLKEDYETYNSLMNHLIESDEGIIETFKQINTEYEKNKTKFNVIEEVE